MDTRAKAFLVGLVAGAASAGVLLVAATFGALIGVPLLVIGLLVPPRLYAASGTLVGFGAIALAIFGRVAIACAPPGCQGVTAMPFVVAGATCLAVGFALLVLAIVRHRGSGQG
jgi:hypothetical protein